MLYERTGLSRKTEELAGHELAILHGRDEVRPALVPRDTYILDLLDLPQANTECFNCGGADYAYSFAEVICAIFSPAATIRR